MRNTMSRITVWMLAALLLSTPLHAYNWLDYFLSPPGVCTAEDPNNSGTFNYIYDAGRTCNVTGRGNVPLYLWYKGGWASESFIASNGWMYLVSEWHPNLCNGSSGYRVFDASGSYGLAVAKMSTTTNQSWNTPSFTLRCGPSCGTNDLNIFQGGGEPNEQALLGMIWDKLYDCRSGVCQGPIPMEVVMRQHHLYPHTTSACGAHYDASEEYWYGRADITQDGVTNPQSVGMVRFVDYTYNHSTCRFNAAPVTGWSAHLKNCNVSANCPYC